ncbi:MAG: methylenetetrahydrofolate reductase [Thermoplasmataceae archaeon]
MAVTTITDLGYIKSFELVPRKAYGFVEAVEAVDMMEEISNVITAPENPMGMPGIDPLITLYTATNGKKMIPVPHITPRDKNRLHIHSQIMTGIKFGINHFFAVGGDPIHKKMDSKEVRELDVVGLIGAIRDARSYSNGFEGGDEIVVGSSLNPFREAEQDIALAKFNGGSKFFITQAFYDSALLKRDWIRRRKFKLIAGFLPIQNEKQLEFLKRIGGKIPAETEKRILSAHDKVQESSRIIREIADDLKGYIDGIHVMPLGNNKIAKDILESF